MLISSNEPFPSLFELAKRACIRNVDLIDDVGDLPYYLLRPILLRLTNPDRLLTIESNSPHLLPDTTELWKTFISQKFGPHVLQKYLNRAEEEGDENLDLRKVFYKLKKKQDQKEKEDIEKLKAEMKKLSDKKEKRTVGRTNVRREDVNRLRSLDRGFGGGGGGFSFGGGSGSGSGWGAVAPRGPFRNRTLNKVLTKGRR